MFLFADKSQVSSILKHFIAYVHKQLFSHIKLLRSDNGSEFLSKYFQSYLASLDIVHQKSCIYTPQQNKLLRLALLKLH